MAFPTTGILSSFTTANEDPISEGGNWDGPVRSAGAELKIVSNQLVRSTAGPSNHSYWTTSLPANQEAWFVVVTVPAASGGVSTTARIASPGVLGLDMYQWTYTAGTGWRMFVVTDNNYVQLGSTAGTPTLANGDSIGFELIGSALRGMHKTGGTWSQITSVTDSTITAGGFIGVEMTDATAVVDDFAGGAQGAANNIFYVGA